VTIPHSIQPFWLKFQAIAGGDVQARFYEAFHFDDNEPSANKLAQLVLVETKRATAGLAWSFEAENRPPPKPGELSVVTNWQGEPLGGWGQSYKIHLSSQYVLLGNRGESLQERPN
jgi:hypothetical protein